MQTSVLLYIITVGYVRYYQAFEPMVKVARDAIADNGLQDRITVVSKRSTDMAVGAGDDCEMKQRAHLVRSSGDSRPIHLTDTTHTQACHTPKSVASNTVDTHVFADSSCLSRSAARCNVAWCMALRG